MKKFIVNIICILTLLMLGACDSREKITIDREEDTIIGKEDQQEVESYNIENIIEKYKNKIPQEWSEKIDGITNVFESDDKEVALTLDACGGENGSLYDKELIDFLIEENIPATLFINYRWIEANGDIFKELSENENFEIENHGYSHKPLSINGNSIYNIEGTKDIKEVIDEIKLNEEKIYEITGKRTKFFRSGTAYYDDVAVKIAEELGYKIGGFSVNSDGGATFSIEQVVSAIRTSKSGDIIIGHFNQPNGNTYEGMKDALIGLRDNGFKFVKLEEIE